MSRHHCANIVLCVVPALLHSEHGCKGLGFAGSASAAFALVRLSRAKFFSNKMLSPNKSC
jgi:hypothetical protein